ncbi:hypothetical protein [Helicobacter anatolicus]|uniref:hypothetical protein n=1 Tax=Helicobacter anatolicus TaxID=2905874 RepID=UPI001E5BDC3F|nr:hypothetical protein [Helicobacter anatolicus]MCE3037863.1 hypothetical protein [Helicobacter anatolicus]
MLQKYLKGAIGDLDALIELTRVDIEEIKQAKHESVFDRNLKKQPLMVSFENKKNMAQQEIINLKNQAPHKPLSELLDEETSTLLGLMREKLQVLKEVNTNYARMVFAVSEFYTSLMSRIVPHEITGYGSPKTAQSTFLKIEA